RRAGEKNRPGPQSWSPRGSRAASALCRRWAPTPAWGSLASGV
ncbi:unnamed protein product, partial [Ectocarpus sp. 12 AP-2014]